MNEEEEYYCTCCGAPCTDRYRDIDEEGNVFYLCAWCAA